MGAAQSQNDDGAPAPTQQPSNQLYGRRTMGSRPAHRVGPGGVAPFNYEPGIPQSGVPPTVQSVESNDPIQQSGIVRNVVNIHKQSLRLVPVPATAHEPSSQTSKYSLQFEFDAQVDGFITVYYCAQQVIQRVNNGLSPAGSICNISYVTRNELLSCRTTFFAGNNTQTYDQHPDKAIDISQFSAADLQTVQRERYPIVIHMETSYPRDSSTSMQERVISQTTFAILEKENQSRSGTAAATAANTATEHYHPKVVAQQALINGTIYKMLDLYGIGGRNPTAMEPGDRPDDDVGVSDECVVCLTEPCTIAVQPCNHLCLCEDCANTLGSLSDRNMRKCPVCRSEIGRLLPIVRPQQAPSRQLNTSVQSKPSRPYQGSGQSSSVQQSQFPSTSDADLSNRRTTAMRR